MNKVIASFHSEDQFLTLSFSPEDNEMFQKKNIYGNMDTVANMSFKNGTLEVYTEKEAIMLRKDKRNQQNGGTLFFELRKEALAEVEALRTEGKKSARQAGDLTDAEKAILEKVWEYADKGVELDEAKDCITILTETLKEFKVKGISKPLGNEPPKVLMALCILAKDTLSSNGISPNL